MISRGHPLYGSLLRVQRAERYIQEAEGCISTFASECEDLVIANAETKTGFSFPPVPEHLPLAISDATHNLRAALDYLVYELAWEDSGQAQEGTQFPIEHCRNGKSRTGNRIGFDAVEDRYLRGVRQDHRIAIEKLQPYNGNHWAQILRDISNPDKHRRLTPIHKGKTIGLWIRDPNGPGKNLPNGDKVEVDADHTVQIQLPRGPIPISSSLHTIEAAVMDVINAFKTEFKSSHRARP